MILRFYWSLRGEHVTVRIFVAHQPFEDGAHVGNITVHVREWIAITQMDFQSEFHEEQG